MNYQIACIAAIFAAVFARSAIAEIDDRYRPFLFDRDYPETITLSGNIDARSPLNFSRAVSQLGSPTHLILSSDGGSVHAALAIAREVNRLGLTTVIPEGSGCYSACAFIFLAGHERHIEGELGVHQISSATPDLEAGQIAISDIIDVLSEFGVSNELLVDMLRTPSGSIHVLSDAEIARYRLEGKRDVAAIGRTATNTERQTTPVDLQRNAIRFVSDYNELWSKPNYEALLEIERTYADFVEFYGERWALQKVMDKKRAFAARWPIRNYSLEEATTRASCNLNDICLVEGEVLWYAESKERSAVSRGRASVAITLRYVAGHFEIIEEDGKVIERY